MGCYLAGSLLITDASVKTLVIIWTWFAALPLLEQGESLRLSLSLGRYRLVVILYMCRVPKVSDRDSNKLETLRILFSEYRYVHGLYSLVNSRDSNSKHKKTIR